MSWGFDSANHFTTQLYRHIHPGAIGLELPVFIYLCHRALE